ncbi:hypothetical protein CCAX7_36250 [Capsulimonas corticalis]|uniref:Uncharacterized protein n=1 Tax=Capsulimonas corticalis TaxID=2219043 RepID=A0A402D6W9_9BACT|nr:hypothetical protein [Capsulimonas corticalis]BDI31574.1 hypothetical protein CCAX7_36250 [Capsulimonas corticalis]
MTDQPDEIQYDNCVIEDIEAHPEDEGRPGSWQPKTRNARNSQAMKQLKKMMDEFETNERPKTIGRRAK